MIVKLLLLLLFALNGFGIISFPNTIVLAGIICVGNSAFFKYNPFRGVLLLIILGIVLSFIPAYIHRNQAVLDTFRASVNYFYIITFFAILKLKPSVKDIEKAMVYLSIITASLYIIQFILLPMGIAILPIERALEATTTEIGRFTIAGSGIFSLVFFYGVNRYILTNRLKYLAISFINIVPIILMGFRTMLAGVALFSIILLFKTTGGRLQKIFKYAIVAFVVVLIGLQIPAVADRVDYMIEKQQEGDQSFANSDYIRWIELSYYTTEYPESNLDRFLGSGTPFIESDFGRFSRNITARGIFWVDWGLIGLSWIIGPFTVLLMIWMNILTIRLVPNRQYLYISMWLLYLITVSFTTKEYYREGNFIIMSIVIYIAYATNKLNKNIKMNK